MEDTGLNFPLPAGLARLLVAFADVAKRSDTLTVFYVANQSAEEIGAQDYHIRDYQACEDQVIRRVRGSPIQSLKMLGLIEQEKKHSVSVTPLGFRVAEQLGASSVPRTETTVHRYLDSEKFQDSYPSAYEKWASAEKLLWATSPEDSLTTIGHLCREAMQGFATSLVERYDPPGASLNPSNTVARVRAVLDMRSHDFGKTEKPFLKALLAYWGTVIDLVERQEHGAQKEGKPLIPEDARRLVFQTMMVMFEIDRTLVELPPE
jgi:hypothetical protein